MVNCRGRANKTQFLAYLQHLHLHERQRRERYIVQGVIKRKFTFREKMIKEASGKVEGLNDEMTPI